MKELSFKDEIPVFMRLEKIAAYSSLTPKQQMQYNDSLNNYLAYKGQLEYQFRVGLEKGEKNVKIDIARKLKAKGNLSIDEISEMTGLTPDEINSL